MNWQIAFVAGGPAFWLLAALGAAALGVFAARFASLRRAHTEKDDFVQGVENVLAENHVEEALAICEETATPLARVASTAIRHRMQSPEALRETVDRTGRAESARLERRLSALALIAQSAPLLGLLGAVLGIMRTLLALEEPAASRMDVTGGVLNALACTAAGLLVAVAVQAMYGILQAQAERIVADLETGAGDILSFILEHPGRKAESGNG